MIKCFTGSLRDPTNLVYENSLGDYLIMEIYRLAKDYQYHFDSNHK